MRAQDVIWPLLFVGMAATSSTHDTPELEVLIAFAVLQVVEPRIPFFSHRVGRLTAVALKLVLGYLLIGLTGGITSRFYLILLLPVVSAATVEAWWGPVMAVLAAGSYLSFMLFLGPEMHLEPESVPEVEVRVLFLIVIAYLARQLSTETMKESQRYQRTAEQLAIANSHLQQAQEAVRRSDRLAALGQLTAGLAHELRNPLGTIRASAEMLGKQTAAEDEVGKELAGYISSEVDRCNALVTRFLDFAKPLQLKTQMADLTGILDEAVQRVQSRQPPVEVALYKNYAPEIPPFRCDPELLERVFYNLVLNAAQATAPGGAVTVKTRLLGQCVEIAVIDRGSGIKPEHRESIFNPFFTTKNDGVGLGLAIVAKIIDEHGGKINVESEIGQGSVFRVVLPLVEGAKA